VRRVQAAGGTITDDRIFGLEPFRAFGDFGYKGPSKIIATPFVSTRRRAEADEYIVLCSDGLGVDIECIDENMKSALRIFPHADILHIPHFLCTRSFLGDNKTAAVIFLRPFDRITRGPMVDDRFVRMELLTYEYKKMIEPKLTSEFKSVDTYKGKAYTLLTESVRVDYMARFEGPAAALSKFKLPEKCIHEPHVFSTLGHAVAVYYNPYVREPGIGRFIDAYRAAQCDITFITIAHIIEKLKVPNATKIDIDMYKHADTETYIQWMQRCIEELPSNTALLRKYFDTHGAEIVALQKIVQERGATASAAAGGAVASAAASAAAGGAAASAAAGGAAARGVTAAAPTVVLSASLVDWRYKFPGLYPFE
jgi:hypothetical protein